MIRFIKYVFLAIIMACLVILALSNRQTVTLSLLTPELEQFLGMSWAEIQVPLYVVIFGGVAIGLLLGFVWEWLRESKHRQEVAKRQRQVQDLKREVVKLKGKNAPGDDDVLALLEAAPRKTG